MDAALVKPDTKTSATENPLTGVTSHHVDELTGGAPQAKGIHNPADYELPTDEERLSLRRVPGKLSLSIFLVAFVEFTERFSYYGSTVVFTNFIQQPLPPGSTTGAGMGEQSGALGMGQRAAFGLTTFNTFFIYVTPILGAYLADTYWGRYNTLVVAVAVAVVGHIILVVCALPSVIATPNGSIGAFALAIIIMGLGTGAFKSNISPLIAEQNRTPFLHVARTKSGEKTIVDPALTTGRIMLYFYLLVNCGALAGQLGMAYTENYHSFWLAYLLPTIILLLAFPVLIFGKKLYIIRPPGGSVLPLAFRLLRAALAPCWSFNPLVFIRRVKGDIWTRVLPSNWAPETRPKWLTCDDAYVLEVRRGFKACQVFVLIPLYWLCYNQILNNLTSQAATMTIAGVPNDVIQNLNPLSLILFIPIFDRIVYPALRKAGMPPTPIKRMTAGFFLGSAAMIWAAVTQYYIYKTSPCGYQAATCDEPSPINMWVQTGSYVLIGFSEIMTSITGLELAFSKAPKDMRSLVTSMWLFTNAISAAIGQAFGPLSADPLLIWNYAAFAIISAVGGVVFWFLFRHLDAEENSLNEIGELALPASTAASTERIVIEKEGEEKKRAFA